MANYSRQQSFAHYKQPVLHKLGKMRDAKSGGLAIRCKCGTFVYGEFSGIVYDAGLAHIKAASAAK
jgi:hypothetical protein